jgi:hypothetical protein
LAVIAVASMSMIVIDTRWWTLGLIEVALMCSCTSIVKVFGTCVDCSWIQPIDDGGVNDTYGIYDNMVVTSNNVIAYVVSARRSSSLSYNVVGEEKWSTLRYFEQRSWHSMTYNSSNSSYSFYYMYNP